MDIGIFEILFFIPFIIAPIIFIVVAIIVFKRILNPGSMVKDLVEASEHLKRHVDGNQQASTSSQPQTYDLQCDHCGAKLSDASEISPHGDVRCEYCNKWFNVKT